MRMRRYNGVHNVLVDSIRKSDMDMRPTLYENIVLCGGGTLFRGAPCIYSVVLGLCAWALWFAARATLLVNNRNRHE
jgi:hypothetical protein